MDSNSKTARIAGILFIFATVTGIISVLFMDSKLETPIAAANIASNQIQLLTAAFFITIMSFACAGIAIALYPVLKKENLGLAIGAVGFRIIEAVFHLISAIALIVLVKISVEYTNAGSSVLFDFQPFSTILKSLHDGTFNLGLMAFTLGAFMYYVIFFQSGLIPRWLSAWGIIGVILTFTLTVLILFNRNIPDAITGLFNFPIAIQEMVLAVWLIVKGFNQTAANE
jgi:hypothetical protein